MKKKVAEIEDLELKLEELLRLEHSKVIRGFEVAFFFPLFALLLLIAFAPLSGPLRLVLLLGALALIAVDLGFAAKSYFALKHASCELDRLVQRRLELAKGR